MIKTKKIYSGEYFVADYRYGCGSKIYITKSSVCGLGYGWRVGESIFPTLRDAKAELFYKAQRDLYLKIAK
jgi:hypothetical protein